MAKRTRNRRKKSRNVTSKQTRPTLQFGPGADRSGFTPTGITGYGDLIPTAVLRELVQNSLDAAVEAGEEPARVRFRLDAVPADDIPGLPEYRTALERAIRSHQRSGQLPDQAQGVVDTIHDCLKNETLDVLMISDNGIGLDKKRMSAILANGISEKDGSATGALGNGHETVIPTSPLRYLLYGGVTRSGRKTGSGHAIIASHQEKKGSPTKSNHGFFIKRFQQNDMKNPYEFPENGETPPLIFNALQQIRDEWDHGSVVIVPGFNHFREAKQPLWQTIAWHVASNFFAPIQQERLVVEVEEDGQSKKLDHRTIKSVLVEHQSEKRSRTGFTSGNRAYEAFLTLTDGAPQPVDTGIGTVEIFVRHSVQESISRINLCRNGMWVSDIQSLPMLSASDFSDRQAFQCVILLNSGTGGELHNLVRKSEGPLHNFLIIKNLPADERRKVRAAFKKIRSFLQEATPKLDTESFVADDILTIQTAGEARVVGSGVRPSVRGTASRVRQRPTPRKKRNGGGGLPPDGTKKKFNWSGTPLLFRALPVPTGARSCHIEIRPEEDCSGSEMRLILEENVDITCDEQSRGNSLVLSNVKLAGKPVATDALVQDDKKRTVGVKLGELKSGESYILETEYALMGDLENLNDAHEQVVIPRVELMRRSAKELAAEAEAKATDG